MAADPEVKVHTVSAMGSEIVVTVTPGRQVEISVEVPELGFQGRANPPWAPPRETMPKAFRKAGATYVLPVYGKTRDGRRLDHIPLHQDAAEEILGVIRQARAGADAFL